MNSRERVLRAFRKKEGLPDRVPLQFDLSRNHLEYFSKKLNIPLSITDNLYEDVTYRISGNDLRVAMGSDAVIVGASVSDDFRVTPDADGTWLNEYGMRMRQGPLYVEVVGYPLVGAETPADVAAYRFPDPDAPGRYRDAEAMIAKYKKDYFVIGDIEVTLFSLAHQLAGFEKVLMAMFMEEEWVNELFAACGEFQTQIALRLIERGVDAFWVGDDFGSQTNTLFAPETFEKMLFPHYKKMIDTLKAANPDVTAILHCDGAVASLLPMIREAGFEVFNPVQPGVPNHSPQEIKDGFGDKFAFWGAIDQQYLMPNGTTQELEDDIRQRIEILGKGGGYMVAPAHIIQDDVSHERVQEFIDLCLKHAYIY